ncbi:winged helix domain-containing protein [Aliiruegeria sabulilitoris]|uniref:winged helix domain-containing protein n=1 Tax=Aliiruegeria sabulilitoris TaxID=1510458 RepID=UPI00082F4732|nr:hypothetical protein [Aliiruegeria sabulilitoris]NDR59198.1 hypothetical protein [Pseudoruegeria sp. M32A2M]
MQKIKAYRVQNGSDDPFRINITGRVNWAMEQLLAAGDNGCTPIFHPAPRWSHYIWVLRGECVEIETIHEPHEGEFPGTHACYVLRSQVTPVTGYSSQVAA